MMVYVFLNRPSYDLPKTVHVLLEIQSLLAYSSVSIRLCTIDNLKKLIVGPSEHYINSIAFIVSCNVRSKIQLVLCNRCTSTGQ